MAMVLLVMGCSSDSDSAAAPAFIPMETSSAQALVDSAVTLCSASGSGVAMGAAPSTINDGTVGAPVNNTYTLSGGSTTITGGHGNLWITGTGTVAISEFTGNVQICGPDVSTISSGSSSATNVNIVNGDAGNVTSFTGNIAIKNGEFTGTASGSAFNIAWEFNSTTQGRTYTGR